ncbi:EDD domain protein, DegV family [Sporobacter termitidis DSM 10068]|uniref:EDD domain protein, DegV family n=1 Tax=Sporobacter termitidis DSM 10068 TaxID=1123282 RepID=A0A1M5X3C5_9FIRM|nr:DegV family protein [Sporobacter termitidis]SHH94092.1 EDD domain protein, DegV family [Sporobacter termitidis DSM 10068]
MNIKITSDSTCDLSKELLDRYDISLIPLYIMKNGKAYRDGVDITPADIFSYVEKTGDFCTTAAVNTFDYIKFFERFSAKYDAVIHINLGSGFSVCHTNAAAAAKVFKNVFVVDSKNLSSGQGLVALEAAKLAASGLDAEALCRQLDGVIDRVETSFLIDRLDYIFKGGRCSLATALGANILHLRTCVEVSTGVMQVTKKYRGAFESAVETYVRDKLQGRDDLVLDRIFITHPAASQKAVAAARDAIGRYAAFGEIAETKAGCTISCHCGPRTLGILFIRK